MDRNQGASRISAQFIDAAVGQGSWTSLLGELSSTLEASAIDLYLLREETVFGSYSWGHSTEILSEYLERFIGREPRSVALSQLPHGSVVSDRQITAESTIKTHEYYRDFLPRVGLKECLAVVPYRDRDAVAYLGVHFEAARPFHEARIRPVLEQFLPALKRALAMQYRLARVHTRELMALGALEHAAGGILVLDGNQRILVANNEASAAISDSGAFRVHNGRLRASEGSDACRMEASLTAAVSTDKPRGDSILLKSNGIPRYSVHINPAPIELRDRTGAAAIVIITDLQTHSPPTAMEQLSQLFRFTPAENRLATTLLTGSELRQAAEQLGITYETARFTLRRVFAKAGVARQSELVRLLSRAVRWQPPNRQERPTD